MIPKVKLHNRFDFEIYDKETGETTFAQAENMLTNRFYQYFGTSNIMAYISVGTGAGTPSLTMTALLSYLSGRDAVATAVEVVYDTELTAHKTVKRVFSETQAIGIWTEVGIERTSSAGNLGTHAFIKDSEGNPITINKTNTKIITVYATVYVEILPPIKGVNMGLGSSNAILYSLTEPGFGTAHYAPCAAKQSNGAPSLITPTADAAASLTNDVANKKLYTSVVRVGATVGNNCPIRGIVMSADFNNTGNIPNDRTLGGMALPDGTLFSTKDYTGISIGTGDGVTTEFDFPLDYIFPESEVIYVDDVAKVRGTDYTIHYGLRSTSVDVMVPPEIYTRLPLIVTEILEIPQPPGAFFNDGASLINRVCFKNTNNTYAYAKSLKLELSEDGVNWITIYDNNALSTSTVLDLTSFTPAKYKYLKATLNGTGSTSSKAGLKYLRIYGTPPTTQKQIKFTTPPASTAVITADFSLDHIYKTENFVVDLQAEMLLGEG